MNLTKTQRLMLYALGQFYVSLSQPLMEKNLRLRTSKITFIELLLSSNSITKQKRAVYRNLEALEKKKLIAYDNHMVRFTDKGLEEFKQVGAEIRQFLLLRKHFRNFKPKGALQTFIGS